MTRGGKSWGELELLTFFFSLWEVRSQKFRLGDENNDIFAVYEFLIQWSSVKRAFRLILTYFPFSTRKLVDFGVFCRPAEQMDKVWAIE